jgi:hypothetical protein
MTTLEIILIIIISYLIIAHIMNFISIAFDCYLMDYEDLIGNLFWIILLPIALIRRFILTK